MTNEQDKAVHISSVIDKLKFKVDPGSLSIVDVRPIKAYGLVKYLETKCIPLNIAKKYLKELYIYNRKSGKHFYVLGLPNEDEGYQLQNEVFEGPLGESAITFIRGAENPSRAINVFYKFMDFASVAANAKEGQLQYDALILNSLSLLKKTEDFTYQHGNYKVGFTWMPNTPSGVKATEDLAEIFKKEQGLLHKPMNNLYKGYETVNAARIGLSKKTVT